MSYILLPVLFMIWWQLQDISESLQKIAKLADRPVPTRPATFDEMARAARQNDQAEEKS